MVPEVRPPGGFLAKDLILLGAAVWSSGEALADARSRADVAVGAGTAWTTSVEDRL